MPARIRRFGELRVERGVFFEDNAQVFLGRSGISSGLQYHQRPLLEVWGN